MNTQDSQPRPVAPAMSLFNTLSRGQKVVLISATLGLISSFLNWYGVSASYGGISVGGSINGWHSWGYLAILGFVAAGGLTLLLVRGRSARDLAPGLAPQVTDGRLILGAGAVSALATIIFMLSEGSGASGPGFSEGPSFGAYLGLLCASVIAGGGYLLEQERNRRGG